ncbi:MAG: hypothetical protein WAU91_09450 [Desulfatitalea sp.]
MRSLRALFTQSVFPVLLLLLLLIACGGGGGSDSDANTPAASVPVVGRFVAEPGYIVSGSGGSVALAWQVSGADRLTITPDVGTVSGASGSTSVHPTVTTTYTLLAENAQGSASATASVAVGTTAPAGGQAYGDVPAGLPARLSVGLVEDPGETWMRDSGVAWDMRYHYFTKGWRDNWTWDPTNSGQWGLDYMNECDEHGFLPVVQYYCMNGFSGYDESAFYATTQNASVMADYFDDFKVLMQRCKEFDKPVLVLMEGDGYAYMEIQTGDNPDAYAAVDATGMPELAGLPDTAAGWGLAFLKIRQAVGADKVILGMHISGWATQKDIGYYQTDVPLQPEVDQAYAFLSKLGLDANVTGSTYDVLVGDPLDRDSGFYEIHEGLGQARWWDASDAAPIDSKSFNRYAEWMRLWNIKAQKRWVLWQIPLGNSNHLNVWNDDGPRQGYKDNRPEYFFANGTDHLRKFADAGAIALLFGPGAAGQSYCTNDVYTDGQLFMQSRAGAILNAGGVPIVTDGN